MDAYQWLFWLTMLYLVVLVTALAAGLIAIARALIITRNKLAKIEGGLLQVESQTQPLGSSLQTVNAALVQISGGLMVFLQYLQNADSSLGRVADKLAARRGTR